MKSIQLCGGILKARVWEDVAPALRALKRRVQPLPDGVNVATRLESQENRLDADMDEVWERGRYRDSGCSPEPRAKPDEAGIMRLCDIATVLFSVTRVPWSEKTRQNNNNRGRAVCLAKADSLKVVRNLRYCQQRRIDARVLQCRIVISLIELPQRPEIGECCSLESRQLLDDTHQSVVRLLQEDPC